MKCFVAVIMIALSLSACARTFRFVSTASSDNKSDNVTLSEEEKHRIYSAALEASESPLDDAQFKEVCRRIGIFDSSSQPNERYMAFVAAHIDWGLKPENREFGHEIDTKQRALEYVNQHLR